MQSARFLTFLLAVSFAQSAHSEQTTTGGLGALEMQGSSRLAETTEEKALREDFSRSHQNIQQLGKDKDFPGLLREAEEVSNEWKAKSMEHYGDLMLQVCGRLRSDLYPRDIPWKEIHELALRGIETFNPEAEDNISIKTHFRLLLHLQENPTYSKGELTDAEWAAKRKTEGERWMVAWDRMEAAIDPSFNYDPYSAPGKDTIGMFNGVLLTERQFDRFSGELNPNMSPETIEDPTLRAEYESVIEENKARIRHRSEQSDLRRLKKLFTRSLVNYFSGTYGIEPYNDAELQDLLSKHVKEEEIRSTILAALEIEKSKVRMEP